MKRVCRGLVLLLVVVGPGLGAARAAEPVPQSPGSLNQAPRITDRAAVEQAGAQVDGAGQMESIEGAANQAQEVVVTPGLATGLLLNAPSRTISGRVANASGAAVANVTFYVQDLNQSPPATVATYAANENGDYSFELGWGRWRVIPTSPAFEFEPDHRDYEVLE